MPLEYCEQVANETSAQSTLQSWYRLRIGRITASKLHEAAHCKTDGTLVKVK